MSKKTIKYISFFDTQDSVVKRNYVTSASNKIEYIAKAIVSIGKEVDIVSISQVQEERFKIYSSKKKQIAEGVSLKLPFSWGGNKGVLRKIKVLWHLVNMFFYLLFYCGKSDVVVVYHSLGYFDIVRWTKNIRKFKLILEVEEVYSDVSHMSSYWRNLEFKMFEIADAFILSNDLLDAKINKYHKPSVVIYGTYQLEQKRVDKYDDRNIHVVYAGTFDPNKAGAQIAISAAEFLPENYHVHICGFGNSEEIKQVKQQIAEMSSKARATITYEGLKKGNEFIEFLQKCHIGLSTQKPEGEYNDTSFPSKILTYMANGLSVVSIRIPVLEQASIVDSLSFYDIPLGKSLADAIMQCDYNVSQRNLLDKLDKDFKNNLKSIFLL
jgi:hypothetical protein